MNRNQVIVVISMAALLVLGIRLTFRCEPDHQKLVSEALQKSIQAGKEGKPGGVLEVLAQSFEINKQSPGTRRDIADFVRNARPDVEVLEVNPVILGNEAVVTSPVRVKFSFLGSSIDRRFDHVSIVFGKREGFQWGIVPRTEWEILRVEVPPGEIEDLFSIGSGF